EAAFLQACQTYFERFAFGTAELADFLEILEEVSNRDMHEWSAAWLQTSGPTTLHATVEPTGAVTIRQDSTDPLTGETELRPHHMFVSVFTLDDNDQLVSSSGSEVIIPVGDTSVIVEDLTLPADQPRVVLVNHHDQTYAQVAFDQASLEAVTTYPVIDPHSPAIATVWSTLWTMVRNATF